MLLASNHGCWNHPSSSSSSAHVKTGSLHSALDSVYSLKEQRFACAHHDLKQPKSWDDGRQHSSCSAWPAYFPVRFHQHRALCHCMCVRCDHTFSHVVTICHVSSARVRLTGTDCLHTHTCNGPFLGGSNMLSMLRLNTEITKPHRTQFQKHDGAVVRRSHLYCQESFFIMTHRDTQ